MKPNTNSIPCTLCSRDLDQRSDKNGKPYFVCEECGTQFFIRGASGKERLSALQKTSKGNSLKATKVALESDLDALQSYIETFCEDELILISDKSGKETAVSFATWSDQVCQRISMALARITK